MARLPGVGPVGPDQWILRDEAYDAQMAFRDHLVAQHPAEVLAQLPASEPVIGEALETILSVLQNRDGYRTSAQSVTRPDGAVVPLDAPPLEVIARLVQEDICLLAPSEGEDRLVAGALLFPASWSLAEKMGRPMLAIHAPVPSYDAQLSKRVNRLFDGLRPGLPLMRMNALTYADPCLFQPRGEGTRRDINAPATYLRSERQCLVRLPQTGAVLFSIHTYVVPLGSLTREDRLCLSAEGSDAV